MKKLSLVLSAIIFFFIFSLKPNALVNNQNIITFNYNDPFVIENHNPDFFGESGYLNQLKNFVDGLDDSFSYSIYFSKDDIFVYKFSNEYYSSSNFSFSLISNGLSIRFDSSHSLTDFYFFRFSDVNNNFSDFKSLISSTNFYYKHFNNSWSLLSFESNNDLRYIDFNYFDYFDDYIIPFYSQYSFKYLVSSSNYFYQKLSINDSVYSVNDTILSYNMLFGYLEPTSNLSLNYNSLYNVGIILDREHLDSTSGSFEFTYSNDNISIDSIDFYGVETVDNVSHYVLINSLITNFDYSLTNSSKHFKFSFSNNSFTYFDLSAYSQIYVKVNFDGSVFFNSSTWNYRFGSIYTINIVLNDLCQDCLFVRLTSTLNNSLVFSKPGVSSSTKLFYNDVSFLASAYGQNSDVYIEPTFYDFGSDTSLFKILSNNAHLYYYDYFNNVSFDKYKIGNDVGLTFNLVHDEVKVDNIFRRLWNWFEGIFHYNNVDYNFSGDLQIIFYITPDLYWGNVLVNQDKTESSGLYMDHNGIVQSFTIYDDFSVTGSSNKSFSNMFKSFLNTSSSIVDAGSEILSLATSLFSSLSLTFKAFILLLFMLGAIGLFIKLIM